MAKVHDWERVYWRNADGSREFFLDEEVFTAEDLEDGMMCAYANSHGDRVSYGIADMVEVEVESDDEDSDETVTEQAYEHGFKYEVHFNGELLSGEDVSEAVQAGDVLPEEEADRDISAFDTRAQAREFSRWWREMFASPEDLGHVEPTPDVEAPSVEEYEIGDYTTQELMALDDYGLLKELADKFDIKQNQSGAALAEQLSGESEPELTADAVEAE